MIYTDSTKKAMILCYEAHKDQKDKSGLPYVHHPFHLAEQMDDEDSTIVALLHDVAEDTIYDIDYIREQGYSDNVVEALELMTHEEGVPYMDYVRMIKENPLATKVKLADLAHNSDTTRLNGEPKDRDIRRVKKYAKAIKILTDTAVRTIDPKYRDAIFGLAIGDALGVPYEFKARGDFECNGMTGFGTYNEPTGTWSDDTSMAIATAKSIKDNGRVDIDDIKDNFLLWVDEDDFNCNGYLFDIGNATRNALATGMAQTSEYSNGNGSLMRILPLAFIDCTDDEIHSVSEITHGHEISKEACVIYVHVAQRLVAGEKIADIVPTLKYDQPFDRLCMLDQLGEDDIESGGYVVDTLEAALWSLLNTNSFEDAVLTAVNLGSDTDTTGAVAGGLAGIVYGLESEFAKECMEKLRGKELIRMCL